jgi:hypothetical protein
MANISNSEEHKVLPFAEWKIIFDNEKATKSAKGKAPKVAGPYSPVNEAPPDAPWYQIDKDEVDGKICDNPNKVLARLSTARPEDRELMTLIASANELKGVVMQNSKTVGIVGQQAMGKSLLINALLHRRNLSKTSAGGGACTASAIKYIHKPGMDDFGSFFDAAIQFMDDEQLNEAITEHIRRYSHFHFSGKVDPTYHDEEERAALTAQAFFYLIYKATGNPEATAVLQRRLTAEDIDNGKLLRGALRMAVERIQDAGADDARKREFYDMNVSELLEQIQNFIAHEEGLPSLWHIVHSVTISMGSALLRNGVSVFDLPGLLRLHATKSTSTNLSRTG